MRSGGGSIRVTITRDGKAESVEIAPGGETVTIGGRSYPVTVVAVTALKVELEIAGEKVVVDNWPDHFAAPPGPVDVNGERWSITVERAETTARGASPKAKPASAAGPPQSSGAVAPGPAGGVPVLPPMPGKIIEVRVAEGARVAAGEILLVLEAMKMRNEVASPAAGVVRALRIQPGANVRAREAMLYVVPE
jgi:biotin carboxyl carrier protein